MPEFKNKITCKKCKGEMWMIDSGAAAESDLGGSVWVVRYRCQKCGRKSKITKPIESPVPRFPQEYPRTPEEAKTPERIEPGDMKWLLCISQTLHRHLVESTGYCELILEQMRKVMLTDKDDELLAFSRIDTWKTFNHEHGELTNCRIQVHNLIASLEGRIKRTE